MYVCLLVCIICSTREPLLARLWSRVGSSVNGFLKSSKQGDQIARKGKFAFICEEPFGHYLSSLPPCELKTIDNFLITAEARTYNFAFKQEEDLKQNISAINEALEKLDGNEQLQELYDKSFRGGICAGCVFSLSFSLLLSTIMLTLSKML